MIRHIVLFKAKDGVTFDDPRVKEALEALRALPEKISGIRQWEHGRNISKRPIAYDYGLNSAFASEEDLAAYADHPAHREVVRLWGEVAEWKICDYVTG